MDTLPDACAFWADRADLLRSLCVELNHLCGTPWSIRLLRELRARVHLCGPSLQTDTWSCGYRLLLKTIAVGSIRNSNVPFDACNCLTITHANNKSCLKTSKSSREVSVF